MSEPFIGEIRIFPYTFTPAGWVRCNGQALNISQFQVLYAVIGTRYGTGTSGTFKVPNLTNFAVMGAGNGPGLTARTLAATTGVDTVTLTLAQIPAHNHNMNIVNLTGSTTQPQGMYVAHYAGTQIYRENPDPATLVSMATATIGVTGQGGPHENRQPFLATPFFIATEGIFPSRN